MKDRDNPSDLNNYELVTTVLKIFFVQSTLSQGFLFFFFKDFIYLFMRDPEREGRDTGRGRSRLHAGSPMWDSIPGPQDHTLS